MTVVFAALVVARYLQNTAGSSIKKIIKTLRTQRSATIESSGQRLTLDLTDTAREILSLLPEDSH